MGATINANDILHTLANNITGSTLSPGSASNAGASAKGQELNAYSKAMKIISDNATYINSKSGTDTAAGDLIEEIFFGQQDATENPYTTGSGGAYGGTGNAVVQGNNFANGFNALFIANGIDQLRQIDAVASDASSTDPSVNASNYRITQAQSGSPSQMTLTLLDKNGSTPTATSAVQYEFRVKSGTAAASLKLGQAETGKATSSTTLVLPHTATLGMTNNIEATVYIYAMNNAGTAELAVVNGQRLDESILHTSTAIDGTATSAGVLYATAARTSVAVRLIGRMRITRDNNTVFDEDPTELSIIGVAGGGTAAGELGSGEKINWVDSSVFIQGANNSITIEADDNFVVNTDTLAQLNSTTKVDTVSPTFNSNANSFIVRSVTASKPVIDFMNDGDNSTAPVLRLINNRSGDGADGDEAGRIEFRSKDDGTPTEFVTAQMFSNVADATAATKSGVFSLQVTHEGSAVNKIVANSTVVAVTGKLTVSGDMTVSGTTTTINSTVSTLKDPIFAIGTADDGAAPGSDDNKDRGILMHYYSGTAKTAFMGWDESEAEMVLAKTVTLSSEALDGTTVYANTHVGAQLKLGSGVAEDTMIVFDGNATDIRLGIRDSTDLFEIGTGTTHGTTPAITINTSQVVNFPNNPQFGGTAIGATAAELNLLDGSAKSTSSITLADADGFIVIDGTTTKQIPASDIKTYAATTYFGGTASSVALAIGQSPSTTDTDTGLFSAAANRIAISAGGTQRLEANTTGVHVTSLTETSSRELKTNITPLNNSLDKIMALQGVNFEWKDESQGKQIGLIADDVAKVVPEVVQFNDKSPTSLQYSKMVALLIEGMKEQQNEINKLKKLVSKSK